MSLNIGVSQNLKHVEPFRTTWIPTQRTEKIVFYSNTHLQMKNLSMIEKSFDDKKR